MALKMRPAMQDNVGVPVKELEAKEAIAQKAPETEEPKIETPAKPEPKAARAYFTAVAKTPVNLRREPKLDGRIVCVLYPGNPIEVTNFDQDWYKLTHLGQECYVRKEYIDAKANK